MRPLFAAAVMMAGFPGVALAQEIATPRPASPIYGSVGYAQASVQGLDLGAVQGRVGAKIGRYAGVETELAAGVRDDRFYRNAMKSRADLENQAAVYGVAFMPLSPKAELFARVGYGGSKAKAATGGARPTESGNSWNYGAGAQYFPDGRNGLRADYTRHDFRNSRVKANVWSVGFVRRF